MIVTLTVRGGPHAGQSISFHQHDTIMVGRGEDVQFRLSEDPSLSRKHFLLEVNPPLCRLHDLKSRTGTKINGRKVELTDLENGDIIHAGQTAFLITVEQDAENDSDATRDLLTLSEASENSPPSNPGVPRLPGYDIHREIARGGMGVVYEGTRKRDGAIVAVKTLLPTVAPSRLAIERFLREARILETLDHPFIVRFLEMGEANRILWFAMEFVPGMDASRYVRTHGPLSIAESVRLGLQLLEGLTFAHNQKFVHRDIKPRNVLLATCEDGNLTVKLSDFGLARTYQASQLSGLTLTGVSGGTPLYMSPDQIRGFRDVKPPADQYSAAATLYFLLTGHPVLAVESSTDYYSVMFHVLEGKLVPIRSRRPEIPEALAGALHKAMSKNPQDRFPDMLAFSTAIRQAVPE